LRIDCRKKQSQNEKIPKRLQNEAISKGAIATKLLQKDRKRSDRRKKRLQNEKIPKRYQKEAIAKRSQRR
jgi:hypothetical protein